MLSETEAILHAHLRAAEDDRDRYHDALRVVVAANDGSLADDTLEFEDLFERGLLRTARDYSDEYHAIVTDAGREFVRQALAKNEEQKP